MTVINERTLQSAAGSASDANLLARAVWARITEPADPVLGALLSVMGPIEALEWLYRASQRGAQALEALPSELDALQPRSRDLLRRSALRWQNRLTGVRLEHEMSALSSFDGQLLTPDHEEWPSALANLGLEMPMCLWVRGNGKLADITRRSVALVGARAATNYGEEVAGQLTSGLCERGFTIVSGGAYGIDIAAQRVALASDGRTVAVMAGGADRVYPRGNAHILEKSLDTGLIISEHPPGSAPTRARFLSRNRLIAALARAVIVVEAAWRSGALSTARHAVKIGRPLGAVPGPITSMMSAGCHELIRTENAVCITDAAEAAELAGIIGTDLAPAPIIQETLFDTLTKAEAAVYEALPLRQAVPAANIARTASLTVEETLAALGRLEMRDIAQASGSLWRRGPK